MEFEYIEAKKMPKPLDEFDYAYFRDVEEWAGHLTERYEVEAGEEKKEKRPPVYIKIEAEKKEG